MTKLNEEFYTVQNIILNFLEEGGEGGFYISKLLLSFFIYNLYEIEERNDTMIIANKI